MQVHHCHDDNAPGVSLKQKPIGKSADQASANAGRQLPKPVGIVANAPDGRFNLCDKPVAQLRADLIVAAGCLLVFSLGGGMELEFH